MSQCAALTGWILLVMLWICRGIQTWFNGLCIVHDMLNHIQGDKCIFTRGLPASTGKASDLQSVGSLVYITDAACMKRAQDRHLPVWS